VKNNQKTIKEIQRFMASKKNR